MANDKTLLYIGAAGVAAYFLLKGGNSPQSLLTPGYAPTYVPPGTAAPVTSPTAYPTNYGINGGYVGNSAANVANYAQLVAANPNLANSNYQLSSLDAQQYLNNYADLQTGLAAQSGGASPQNIQRHWSTYGVPERRIFLPLVGPSGAPYHAPPTPPKSSGGGFFSIFPSILGAAAKILPAVLGPNDIVISPVDAEILLTGGYFVKNILPFYRNVDKQHVDLINNQFDTLVSQFS